MTRRTKYKKRRRRKKRVNKNTTPNLRLQETRFKYRQIYSVQVGELGLLRTGFQVNSFTNFYTPYSGAPAVLSLNEPISKQKGQFDSYKPTYIQIKYTPRYNNGNWINNLASGTSPPIYIAYDSDNTSLPKNIQTLVTRDHVKVYSPYKPWTYGVRLPNMKLPNNTGMGGFNNLQNEINNRTGVIWIGTTNQITDYQGNALPEGNQIGDFLVTYYCSFKGRQYNEVTDPLNPNYDATVSEDLELDLQLIGVTGPTGPQA